MNAVRKSFGGRTVLDGLDFAIEQVRRPNKLLSGREPTNHLDIDSVEALEVDGGEARSFEGGYSDWFERSRAAVITAQ